MKVYHLQRKQFLPLTLKEVWAFFSSPRNLEKITPGRIGFKILFISGNAEAAYPGQIIHYKINLFPMISVQWVTEITHVKEPYFFVDDQRSGPYALWHHQHNFKEVPGGVEMMDEITYAIPFGLFGRIANYLFVERELKTIFDFRYTELEKLFTQDKFAIKKSA